MKATNKIAFLSGKKIFFVDKELRLSAEDALAWERYYEDNLKPLLRSKKIPCAYIVRDTGERYAIFTIDDPNGSFWNEYMGGGKLRPRSIYGDFFEVRRVEFNFTDLELYCSDPYFKEWNDVADNWPSKGILAFEPAPGDRQPPK